MKVNPTLRETASWYTRRNYLGRLGPRHIVLHRINSVDRVLNPTANERIVDVGCGPGFSSTYFARHGARVTAIDIDDKKVDFGRLLAVENGVEAKFVVGAAFKIDLADEGFAAAVSMELFEHVPEWQPVLAQLDSLVRPGGRIIVSTPTPYGIAQILKSTAKQFGLKRDAPYEKFIWPLALVREADRLQLELVSRSYCGLVMPFFPAPLVHLTSFLERVVEPIPGLRMTCATAIFHFQKKA